MAEFEVRCLHCDVSFPVGTKKCLHCGQKIGRTARSSPELGEMPFPVVEEGPLAPDSGPGGRGFSLPGFDQVAEEADGASESVPRSMARMGMTLVWVVILAAGLLARMCEGQ